MPIDPPSHVTGPDRYLDCQLALEERFRILVEEAIAAGWGETEVLSALTDLADNHMLARLAEMELQAFLRKLKDAPPDAER